MTKAKRSEKEGRDPFSSLPILPALLEAHPGISEALARWKESKRIPPVLLLTGPSGCGKRMCALHIAQALQCERAGFFEPAEGEGFFGGGFGFSETPPKSEGGPCGECASCLRALSGQAIDFTEIRLEDDEKTFGVDRFREIKEKQGFSSFGGGPKIYLIPDADRMTLSAANSVLKLLEEPPAGWACLLTVTDPSLLPSTVVSRCQMLRLRPLPDETLLELLREDDLPADRIATVAKIAEGSLTRARDLAGDEAWATRGDILRFLGQPSSAYHSLIEYAATEPARFRLLLDQFEHLLADLIRTTHTPGTPFRNLDAKRSLEEHAKKCIARKGGAQPALAFWMDRSERLFRLRREVTAPLNTKVLVQDFLSPWMDAV